MQTYPEILELSIDWVNGCYKPFTSNDLKLYLQSKGIKISAKTYGTILKDLNALKLIKEKTKEDNILNIIYEMYDSCNKIEEKIKQYYATENDILIFKDNGTSQNGDSTPSAAYSWNQVLKILKNTLMYT